MMRQQREEPHKVLSGALSVAVHLVLLGVLIYGVSWQNREAGPVQADLWSDLPGPQTTAKPEPPPPPEPESKPEPPKPEPKPEPKPAPQPKAEPTPSKADIELKAKKLEEEKKKQEQLKREEEKKKQDEEAKRKQDEAKRKEQERARQEKAAQAAANAARAAQQAAQAKVIGDYTDRIRAKIKRFVVMPPNVSGNPQAEFDVTLMPTGEVLTVRLISSSGVPAYDSAVERAIYKAQPLPLPPDPGLFGQFRELHLKFRPNE